jgi:hypothetical protein
VNENIIWRIKYNEEINMLLKGEDVERIGDHAMSKRMIKG